MEKNSAVKKLKTMIVEAEDIVASEMQSMLEGMGYAVTAIAFSGEEAIEKAGETLPDLVLIDTMLKEGMDSIEVAKRIHNLFDIPSAFLVEPADEEKIQCADITEVFGYIFKPFVERELDSTIKLTLCRHKAEEESKLKAEMLNKSMSGIILSDISGKIIYANDTALKERGYTREEFLRMNVRDLVEHRKTRKYEAILQEVVNKGYFVGEFEVACKGGLFMPVEATLTLVSSGEVDYVISITQDISRRKKMEKERQEIEHKAQVSSRLALVGEMAAGIAHEINNPLTGVIGFAQLLQGRKDLPDDVREKLNIISEGGQRMAGIIVRLLTFARQSKLSKAYVDINGIVRSTLNLMRYDMETSKITVTTRLKAGLPHTMADAGQLKQVFLNIVINARQEMEKAHGGGRLRVKTELVDGSIRISFKDDGPGIAKENLDKVFDPFFTTKEVGEGTGLGLSLSHGIVAEHKGRLYAESKERRGATFVVELPLTAEGRQDRLAEAGTVEKKAAVGGKILVVDDEKMICDYLEQELGKAGHHVDVERDARMALKRLAKDDYDVIMADVKMPGMNGREFYQELQEMGNSLLDKVVFMTGDIIRTETRSFLKRTGLPYITKPFDANQLKEMVTQAVCRSKG
jgi:PAS domain S-box-containing protein